MAFKTDPELCRIRVQIRVPSRYSLRALLIALAVVGAGLGLYGRHLAEERRQLRLLDDALGWAAKDGSLQDAEIGESGESVLLWLDGRKLNESTIDSLAEAKLVFAVSVSNQTESIRSALSEAFVHDPRSKLWLRRETVSPESR